MSVPPRAYLLDALGTLLELEPPAPLLREELRARFGLELSAEEVTRAVRAEIAYYRAHHDEARDRPALARLRADATRALRDALPPGAPELPLAELTEALLASLRFPPYPEVVEVLTRARERGIRLVVVSNWDVSLHDALAAAGLDPLLDGVVTSAELGVAKPDPAIFAHALALAGVSAQEAVHVGDSVEADVAGARAAGIAPLLVVREGAAPDAPPPPGVATIATLRELPGLDP